MAVHYLKDNKTKGLLEHAERTYASRRNAFLNALKRAGVQAHGRSGFNVWVPVSDEAYVAQRLLQAGWMVTPGHRYRLQSPPAIRVTVSALPENDAERLANEIGNCLRRGGFRSSSV